MADAIAYGCRGCGQQTELPHSWLSFENALCRPCAHQQGNACVALLHATFAKRCLVCDRAGAMEFRWCDFYICTECVSASRPLDVVHDLAQLPPQSAQRYLLRQFCSCSGCVAVRESKSTRPTNGTSPQDAKAGSSDDMHKKIERTLYGPTIEFGDGPGVSIMRCFRCGHATPADKQTAVYRMDDNEDRLRSEYTSGHRYDAASSLNRNLLVCYSCITSRPAVAGGSHQ